MVRALDQNETNPRRPARAVLESMLFGCLIVAFTLTWLRDTAEAAPGPTLERGSTDLVLLIDTSKTMIGKAGGTNIFGPVRETCKQLIRELHRGDTVTLIPFATDVTPQPTVTLQSEMERDRLYSVLDGLRANGDWTYTSEALRVGLGEAARLEGTFPDHTEVVVILTDGINDPPPRARLTAPRLVDAARPFAGKPWYVYQVQLGPVVDEQLNRALELFPNRSTIHDPRGVRLKELPSRLQPPPPPPRPVTVDLRVQPPQLRVRLTPGQPTAEATANLTLPKELPAGAIVTKVDREKLPPTLTVSAEIVADVAGTGTLRVRARTTGPLANGAYRSIIRLSLADGTAGFVAKPFDVPLEIASTLVPPVWPYWVGGFLLAALLVAAGLAFWRARALQTLFGTIEAWPTASPAQRRRVEDLSGFGSRAVVGSRDVILPGAVADLGRLVVRKHEGERHVVLIPAPNARLLLGDRSQAELVLYDDDTFRLDTWTAHYRGEVSRRSRD